ncbi:reticulocyte-binding protein 2 a [Podospora conica]|nr:reticulocyte-binding protein 2 a [Schizothecium conicum]
MAHHEPFKSLGPIAWDTILLPSPPSSPAKQPTPAPPSEHGSTPLPTVLTSTFDNAQILVDSIPSPSSSSTTTTHRRPRSHTESSVSSSSVPTIGRRERSATHPEAAALLRKEWKEVKVSAKDNPLGISVYKMAAKDGKGSWFARRSVHGEVGFEKWRMGLQREFEECLACETGGGEGGSGSVRGIGAERRVGRRVVEGVGVVDVFLVSVRFPGPTTPRDFVTMLAMPDNQEKEERDRKGGKRLPRQFMLVSRPCDHPETPARSGFIRGTYESVEVIREIPVDKAVRRTRSSIDLNRAAVLRAARQRSSTDAAHRMGGSDAGHDAVEEEQEMEIEWLMVTRSDPGGSVPRFMVEKGTPGGIINDAGKFLKWIAAKNMEDLAAEVRAGEIVGSTQNPPDSSTPNGTSEPSRREPLSPQSPNLPRRSPSRAVESSKRENSTPTPSGFYGMIAGALEAAGSVVINRMGVLAGSSKGTDDETLGSETESDLSDNDYASAEEGEDLAASAIHDVENGLPSPPLPGLTSSAASARSTISEVSQLAPSSTAPLVKADQHRDKELRRLHERQRRAEEKIARTQERHAAKSIRGAKHGGEESDAQAKEAALAKLREKHERELAKQEEKYQREVRRIHEKREAEARKAEERRRKAQEREERSNLQAELERVKAERDVALREIEMLKEQVGALQGQNTMLVARLGREGGWVGLEEDGKRG